MKETNTQKGITLIALIITIVVLLILAVVAIGAAQESNIVGYAQNAAGKYEQAQANEISLLSQYENKMENIIKEIESKEYPAYRLRIEELNYESTIILISEKEAIAYVYATNSEGQTVENAEKVQIMTYTQGIGSYEVDDQYGKRYSYAIADEDSNTPVDAVYCQEDDVWIMAGMFNGKIGITKAVYYPIKLSAEEINTIIKKAN